MQALQRIQDKVAQVKALAMSIYGVDLSDVALQFNLTGAVGGWASRKQGRYLVRLNSNMISRGGDTLEHIINDTVPHEYAHIVCYKNKSLGDNHDNGWRNVCIALGGSGERCHQNEVIYARGGTYEYLSTTGNWVRVGEKYHREIQNSGQTITFRKGKGKITKANKYRVIARDGVEVDPDNIVEVVPAQMIPVPGTYFAGLPKPMPVPTAATIPVLRPAAPTFPTRGYQLQAGEAKANCSRRIMQGMYKDGHSYEAIITAMIAACGYDRQLARGTFKANALKVGIPATFK